MKRFLFLLMLLFIPFVVSFADNKVTGVLNGHEYVDLGLPSGTMWATCNIGSNKPSDDGLYFAWGTTISKDKYKGDLRKVKRYKGAEPLPLDFDAAHVNWGKTWRLPTLDEQKELLKYCSWLWTSIDNKKGYKVTGSNGNSIFLPAAGGRNNASYDKANVFGNYWSSTIRSDDPSMAWLLYLTEHYRMPKDNHKRITFFTIRPVCTIASSSTKDQTDSYIADLLFDDTDYDEEDDIDFKYGSTEYEFDEELNIHHVTNDLIKTESFWLGYTYTYCQISLFQSVDSQKSPMLYIRCALLDNNGNVTNDIKTIKQKYSNKSPIKLKLTLSNGEVFTSDSSILVTDVSPNSSTSLYNLISNRNKLSTKLATVQYALKQLTTYNIISISFDDHWEYDLTGSNSVDIFKNLIKEMKMHSNSSLYNLVK